MCPRGQVDENTLTWPDTLRMLLDILPNAEEATKLLGFSGDLDTLDRPERVLRSVTKLDQSTPTPTRHPKPTPSPNPNRPSTPTRTPTLTLVCSPQPQPSP